MQPNLLRRAGLFAGGFLCLWLFLKYLFPIALPFLLGLLLAITAEPAVRFGTDTLKLPRWAATGLGVTLTLLFLLAALGALGAVAVKELGVLAGKLPDLQETAQQTVRNLESFLKNATTRSPESIRPLMDRSVARLFSSGSRFVEEATVRLPSAISAFLSHVPDGALGIGTGILSGFMFSARLPRLKKALSQKIPPVLSEKFFPAWTKAKTALAGWFKAQLKLSAITYCIVTLGFLLLRIPYAPFWAILVALVDAVPLFGTGTVLLPWALVCLFQQAHFRSIGLLCLYGATFFTRTILEPRLVGRHLGLDPLVTLLFLYLGYRFWGIAGMLFSPMLAAAITAVSRKDVENPSNG